MVLIIVYAQVLLLCVRGAEPKIVYSRPVNDNVATTTMATAASAESAETDDEDTTSVTSLLNADKTEAASTTMVDGAGSAMTVPLTGRRYADNDSSKSMSAKAEHYGIQFFAPPVIHGTTTVIHGTSAAIPAVHAGAVDVYGRPVHGQHLQRHQPTPLAAYYGHHLHRQNHRPQHWEPTAAMIQVANNGGGHGGVDGGGGGSGSEPTLMNPLLAAYGDPSTVRYPPLKASRRPVARLVKYSEPTALAFQIPFLAAEADDETLLENLPALQLALQHAASTGKLSPTVTASSAAALHHMYKQPHHHHRAPGYHHLHHLPHHHHPHQQYHRYAPTRYTQVPFLYNVPAPPPLLPQRNPAPAEYDLVTRFNRLLKEREKEDLRKGAVVAEEEQGQPDEPEPVVEDEDEETTAQPVTKTKKTKRKRLRTKKRRPLTITPKPAPVVEEEEELPIQQYDERSGDEQVASDEQESQNVANHEKMPEETIIHETETDSDYQNQNAIDGPSEISEHFGGDLTFDDSDGERVEFQLHGIGGPDSYKFGYDTGKGTNRQFRYEERDNGGYVRGHYGYLDHDGKMQVYNYSSHPELGFQSQKAEDRYM